MSRVKESSQMPYEPIQCDHYDYIEIACMRRYRLDIQLITGEIVRSVVAKNTRVTNREEFLIVDVNSRQQEIRLDKIKTLSVLDKNAEFTTVNIND